MFYQLRQKKYLTLLAILVIIAVVALAYWLWLASWFSSRLAQQPDWKSKILSAPQLPTETSIVLSYTGQIQRIDLKAGELTMVTAYGNKTIIFDEDTPIRQLKTQPLPTRAPSAQQPPRTLETLSLPKTLTTIKAGDLIQASSLTDVRGLATFKANTIVVLQ
ncbi:MAG: hypothetical protein V1846_01515 [Candidatus Komeilibacteria bacterium]